MSEPTETTEPQTDDNPSTEELENRLGKYTEDILKTPITDLIERVYLAETVCLMLELARPLIETDQQKALHEVWSDWAAEDYVSLKGSGGPDLSDSVITQLAELHDLRQNIARQASNDLKEMLSTIGVPMSEDEPT